MTKTAQKFKNGECVWVVTHDSIKVGEFWPVTTSINLVTKTTDPQLFDPALSLSKVQEMLGGVAMAPDGMTTGSVGTWNLEGKCLSNGRPCGDGSPRNYGVVVVLSNRITFTHFSEIADFDAYYEGIKKANGTLFFLPSILRNGSYKQSSHTVDKVLIRRDTPGGPQIGVIVFDHLVTYDEAREIACGLDRTSPRTGNQISKTTHIYALDGGPNWGQSCKEVNGNTELVGTRNPAVVSNYLVFY